MRLSEAIRLGSMIHPQGFGRYHSWSHEHGSTVTCALGAAEDAGYFRYNMPLLRIAATCPASEWCRVHRDVFETIVHLNDDHHWTREAIADWIEAIEIKHSTEIISEEAVLA